MESGGTGSRLCSCCGISAAAVYLSLQVLYLPVQVGGLMVPYVFLTPKYLSLHAARD